MNKFAVFIFALVSFLSLETLANAKEECTGAQASSEKCRYFLKGYVYGLNDAAADKLADKEKETFTERAIRTRLGIKTARNNAQISDSAFCIPDNVSIPVVAQKLQADFSANPSRWADESDPIGKALQENFPC